MKAIKNISAAIIIAMVALTGCETYVDVYSDYDNSVNFTRYTTYAWLADRDSTHTIYNNQVVRNNARNFVNNELASRNFRIETSKPDVFLDLVVKNGHKETVTYYYQPAVVYPYPYYPYYPYSPNPYYSPSYPSYSYYYSYPYSYGYSTASVAEYDVDGSITLNMIDRRDNKLVWTATAKGYLYDPDYNEDNLSVAVEKIMDTYPVSPALNPSGE